MNQPHSTQHLVSPRLYFLIFAALIAGTLITVSAALVDLEVYLGKGPWNISLALTIAVTKATLVVLYFMHMRWSHRLNWVFAGASLLWLALLIGMTSVDFIVRATE